jgi:hypothetical protein
MKKNASGSNFFLGTAGLALAKNRAGSFKNRAGSFSFRIAIIKLGLQALAAGELRPPKSNGSIIQTLSMTAKQSLLLEVRHTALSYVHSSTLWLNNGTQWRR